MKRDAGYSFFDYLPNSKNIRIKNLRLAIFEENQEKLKEFTDEELNSEYDLLGCSYFSYFNQSFEWTGFYTFFSWFWDDSPIGEYYSTYEWYLSDKNKTHGNYIPWTPLQYAVACNKPKSVDWLLKMKVDQSKKDKIGRTALEIAEFLSSGEGSNFYNLSKDRSVIIQLLKKYSS
jgi:hypothetical protein